ncbi:hypothetical protein [Algoriphagus aquimarinus]|uniref:hypothetical protein n=1 Tax=Algoriphagus aquimarinus TaxID=237018 RepID=UPI0030D74C17|tara:strand:+ start:2582 stop:3259 length:678 start_codon:yes stop_codon:yes gene_type:complete
MEGSGKQPMNESQRTELEVAIRNILEISTQYADHLRSSIKSTKIQIDTNETKIGVLPIDHKLRKVLRLKEFLLLLQLITSDIACAYRFYLNGEYLYEGAFSAKLLIIVTHEASKKIFHFSKYRKVSFWGRDIKQFMVQFAEHSISEYERIELMIQSLDTTYSEFNWEYKRKILVHYDDNPSELYDLLTELNIEEITRIAIMFIRVQKEIMEFSIKLLNDYYESPK